MEARSRNSSSSRSGRARPRGRRRASAGLSRPVTGAAPARTCRHRALSATGGGVRITVSGGAVPLSLWRADSSNEITVGGGLALARKARRGRRRRGRPLPAAQEDRRAGSLLRARGLDARPSTPAPPRRRVACNRGRTPADCRREEDAHSSLGRRVRRLPARRSPREAVAAWRPHHRTRRARRWRPAPPQSSCSRIACRERSPTRAETPFAARPSSRGQPIETSGRSPSRPMRTAATRPSSPPPTRRERPGHVERPGRVGPSLVRLRSPQRVVLAAAQRGHGREAALERHDARPPGVDTGGGRVLPWPARGSRRAGRRDQASRGSLAGERWTFFAAPALERPRQDPPVLGERLRIVLTISRHTWRRRRPWCVADEALATDSAGCRLPHRRSIAFRPGPSRAL